MSDHMELTELYFQWLKSESFKTKAKQAEFEGVLRLLHDIPFYWTIWQDENRAGDALAFRQYEFLVEQDYGNDYDQHWLNAWATAAPSVLEVMLGIARRWSIYFGDPVPFYFQHLFNNMEFNLFPGHYLAVSTQDEIRNRVDIWLTHQYEPNGHGSPFPVDNARVFDIIDMRHLEIMQQMNAYSAVHFQ